LDATYLGLEIDQLDVAQLVVPDGLVHGLVLGDALRGAAGMKDTESPNHSGTLVYRLYIVNLLMKNASHAAHGQNDQERAG
jgi:hypothetical protein